MKLSLNRLKKKSSIVSLEAASSCVCLAAGLVLFLAEDAIDSAFQEKNSNFQTALILRTVYWFFFKMEKFFLSSKSKVAQQRINL